MSADVASYEAIFRHRGASYHQAMALCPEARRKEFTNALDLIKLFPGMRLVDVPSGGGYLKRYIHERESAVEVIELDPSQGFLTNNHDVQLCRWHQLPLAGNSVDCIVSIAGLHHLKDRQPFYRECQRLLQPQGQLVIAEVGAGSREANFLNVAVDQSNPLGHNGYFLGPQSERDILQESGFDMLSIERKDCGWRFPSFLVMSEFCRYLFGMQNASVDEVRCAIEKYLLVTLPGDGATLAWSLDYYVLRSLKD